MLEAIRSPILTYFFKGVTVIGEQVPVLLLLCLFYWCINKKAAYRMAAAVLISTIVVQCLKITFRIERPWILDPGFNPVEGAIKSASGYSFPSGHTQAACAMFGSLFFYFKGKIEKILCFLIICSVALSRMYLGVHTPYDIAASLIVSSVILALLYLPATDRIAEKFKNPALPYIIFLVVSLFGVGYALIVYKQGIVDYAKIDDCLKSAGAGIGCAVGLYIERNYINFGVETTKITTQLYKIIVGLGVTALIYFGLGTVIEGMVLFVMLTVWVFIVFPIVIKRVFSKV
jgi:undecaprenyl-diphosphatase